MKKRDFMLDRGRNKRVCVCVCVCVCECGGELEFLGVDYGFRPHVRCLKCGKEHIGIEGTKRENDD